jgi:hypothetical protein
MEMELEIDIDKYKNTKTWRISSSLLAVFQLLNIAHLQAARVILWLIGMLLDF